jgi:hypothetical protein
MAARNRVAATQAAQSVCVQHPNIAAVARCGSCGMGICQTCDFLVPSPSNSTSMLQLGGNMHLCPNCIAARGAGGFVPSPIPRPQPSVIPLGSGIVCTLHAGVPAVRNCHVCHKPMCQTCDFELPGQFHVCPNCATNPDRKMGSSRKRNLIIAYLLGGWSTLGLALLLSGVFAGMAKSKSDLEAIGVVISMLVFLPALAGIALSISSLDRKLGNPGSVWGAVVWNSINVAVLILLVIIGNMK